MYEIINSYLKLFPTNKVVINSSAPAATIAAGDAAHDGDDDATVTINGNKYAGHVTLTTGAATTTGTLATITLNDTMFDANTERLLIQLSPTNEVAAALGAYAVDDGANPGVFLINTATAPDPETAFQWDYVIHRIAD